MSTRPNSPQMREESSELRRMIDHQTKEKKVKCPRWLKTEPIKNFLSNLAIWNKCHNSKGKYLELIEALQESQRFSEKQRIELEVQNGLLDPCNENVVEHLIRKMNDSWTTFSDMK